MPDSIYHHQQAKLDQPGLDMNASASVVLFHSGTVIVSMHACYGAVQTQMHIDTDSLRAFAKLLNDAVDALPAKVEEAA